MQYHWAASLHSFCRSELWVSADMQAMHARQKSLEPLPLERLLLDNDDPLLLPELEREEDKPVLRMLGMAGRNSVVVQCSCCRRP